MKSILFQSLTQLTEEKGNCYIFYYVGEPPFSTELSLMVDRAAFPVYGKVVLIMEGSLFR